MDIFEESFKAFSEMKTSKQVNISHKNLTENVDVNKLEKWLKEEIEFFTENPEYTVSTFVLDSTLCVAIGWLGGYDINDTSIIHNPDDPTYALNAGIKIRNSGEWEFEFLDSPYNLKTNEVWDTDVSLSSDPAEIKSNAEWFKKEYESMEKEWENEDSDWVFESVSKKATKDNTITEKVQSRDLYNSIYNYLTKRNSTNIDEETIKDLTNELVDWYNNFMEEKDASNINDIIKNYIRYSGYNFYIKPLTAIVESKIKTNKVANESLSNYDASLDLVDTYGIWDLDDRLWSGAQDRWKDYTDEQKKYLMDYFASYAYDSAEYPSLTSFNDFIWFESDDILAESDLVDESCKSYRKKKSNKQKRQ